MNKSPKNPKVSVFIPYYNDHKFLGCAIESVLSQDYENFELILLNHATQDDCREIAHSFSDTRIIHIDFPSNLGAGSGLLVKTFFETATGEYLKLFCADDKMKPNCLSTLVKYMQDNPKIDFAFGDVEYMDENNKELNKYFFNERPHFSLDNDNVKCIKLYRDLISFLPYIGSIIKSSVVKGVKLNKTFIMLFDMSLWLRLLLRGYNIGYCTTKVANYRLHKGQLSSADYNNTLLSSRRSFFEIQSFLDIFSELKDVELARKVFSEDEYSSKITQESDINFLVAHYFLYRGYPYGYLLMNKMVSDEEEAKYLQKKFNYGIREFRKDYSTDYQNTSQTKLQFKNMKQKIYSTPSKELGLCQLAFLMLHCFWNVVTLRRHKRIFKIKKNYSL